MDRIRENMMEITVNLLVGFAVVTAVLKAAI